MMAKQLQGSYDYYSYRQSFKPLFPINSSQLTSNIRVWQSPSNQPSLDNQSRRHLTSTIEIKNYISTSLGNASLSIASCQKGNGVKLVVS